MTSCPVCRTRIARPTTRWVKFGSPDKNGVINRYLVGTFTCTRCRKVFDQALEVKRVKLVELEKLDGMAKRLEQAEREKKELEEMLQLARLEQRMSVLEVEVALLRERREQLSSRLAFFQAYFR